MSEPNQKTNGLADRSKSEAFRIQSAAGEVLEIPAGEYYFNTKMRARRLMLNSLSGDSRRIYACLELATMGFKQELAIVSLGRGKTRPLTPGDIAEQTGLSKQHVRRGLAELEAEGLALRRSDDGGELRNGHMLLYSWASPQPVAEPKKVVARGYLPSWVPDSWEPIKPLISRLKLTLSEDLPEDLPGSARDYLESVAEVARAYQNAEKVAIEALERVRARPPLIRKKEKKEIDITSSSGSGRTVDHPTTTDKPSSSPPPEKANPGDQVRAALALYGTVDNEAPAQLWRACRLACADCSPAEVLYFIHDRGAVIRAKERGRDAIGNPIGFLLHSVPKMFRGPAIADHRNDESKRGEAERQYREREDHNYEQTRARMREQLEDPATDERDRAVISNLLGVEYKPLAKGASS